MRRIGLLGAESTGKSTLARELGEVLPGCVVGEALRDFVHKHGRTPQVNEQQALLHEQAAREDEVAAECTHTWLIADPAPLMTAIYSLEYFDDGSLVSLGIALARNYDLLVWCGTDIPWTPDPGQRDGGDRRSSTDATIARVVRAELTDAGIDVVHVTGSVQERVAAVWEWLAWQHGRSHPAT